MFDVAFIFKQNCITWGLYAEPYSAPTGPNWPEKSNNYIHFIVIKQIFAILFSIRWKCNRKRVSINLNFSWELTNKEMRLKLVSGVIVILKIFYLWWNIMFELCDSCFLLPFSVSLFLVANHLQRFDHFLFITQQKKRIGWNYFFFLSSFL